MKITLSEISALVKGELCGDGDSVIEAAAPIELADKADITFAADIAKQKKALASCQAGCVILPQTAKTADTGYKGNIIYAENPHWAFVIILRQIAIERKSKIGWGVHETAVIAPTAKIGKYTFIGPHVVIEKEAVAGDFCSVQAGCYIGEKTQIGNNCALYPNAVIYGNCVIKNRVTIHSGAVIGADGFGYIFREGKHEKIPQLGRVIIEDDVEIGALTAIDRAALTDTVIGAGTKIDNLVQIAHNVKIGKNCAIAGQTGIAGSCEIGDNVIIAGQVGIADHIKVGSGAKIAAQSGVMADVKDGEAIFGTPSRPIAQALKIHAVSEKLPEIYKLIRKLKAKFEDKE
ncbi:MAG: UDP-3-O-(3-hydroxymyristoyl)glucosamine N-acyltransferase [Elusimicrobia bacterium]|nr:UDP-3-O-(3-hydroxymyristoyl)glucosamine N-acyltransferase [Elusimicrobiota bacterium]